MIGGSWKLFGHLNASPNTTPSSTNGIVINKQQGIMNVHSGSGDIYNFEGITLEQYETGLRRREKEVTEHMKAAHIHDLDLLKKERTAIEQRLSDIKFSYEGYLADLKDQLEELEKIRGQVPDKLFQKARDALLNGDNKKADDIFKKIEGEAENTITAAAEAAYQRSRIAASDFQYLSTLEHSIRATQLAPKNAFYLNNAGLSAYTLGKYAAAQPYLDQALALNRGQYGEEHPFTVTSYNNVASNLNKQGKHEEAEPLFRNALEISKRVLGEEHPLTVTSYNNVASNLNEQGKYEEAEPLFRNALEISKRVLGEEHPDTATSYNNVAANLNAQGKYEEAEPLYRNALEIRQRVLGEEHPSTASSYNNAASNLNAQGKYEEAEPLYRKSYKILSKLIGKEHPNSKTVWGNWQAVKLKNKIETD